MQLTSFLTGNRVFPCRSVLISSQEAMSLQRLLIDVIFLFVNCKAFQDRVERYSRASSSNSCRVLLFYYC